MAQQWRMTKFADSLMKQRQLQERERQERRRSLSKERLMEKDKTEKQNLKKVASPQGPALPQRSPVKFPSMSDVRASSSRSTDQQTAVDSGPATNLEHLSAPGNFIESHRAPAMSPQSLPAHLLSPSRPPHPPSPSHPLPPHLADLVVSRPRAASSSRDSLTLSRTSAGNSIETVVSAHRREEERSEGDTEEEAVVRRRARSTSREDTPVSSFSEGALPGQNFLAPPPPRHAWREGGAVGGEDDRRRGRFIAQSSEPSSVPSTSDEEAAGPHGRREEGGDSTLESARLIDRAKSFEYIPGSSFPLQENSSSYEYLPGHLVADARPPTVLTRHVSPATTSELTPGENLGQVSAELKEKSKELLTANLLQTKHFFKKLKNYIDFLSTPSLTVEDCQVKQELATRITALLSTEETRLRGSSSRQSAASSAPKLSFNTSKEGSIGSESRAEENSSEQSLRPASRLSEWRSGRTRSEEQWSKAGVCSLQVTEDLAGVLEQRQQHMKKIKREMRKLEKLDRWLLKSGRGRMVESLSEVSIHTTISTLASDTRVSAVSSRQEGIRNEREGGKIEEPALSAGSKGKKTSKSRGAFKENLAPIAGVHEAVANFGQMFPSDAEEISRIETKTVTNTTLTLQQSVHIQTETVETSADGSKDGLKPVQRSPRRKRVGKGSSGQKKDLKPVAYFLPMETLSPVRLGRRVLREVGNDGNSLSSVNNLNLPDMMMSAGNREMVAGYVAGLEVTRPATAPVLRRARTSGPKEKLPRQVVSLQEALTERRRDFVRQSEARQAALAAAREARLLRREKQSAWLEEVAQQSPRLV